MTQAELDELRRSAETETPMTHVALEDMANPEHVRRQMQREFETALRRNESTEKLIQRLQRVSGMSRERAARIAQTERTRATNGGRYAAAVEEYEKAYKKAVRQHKKRPPKPVFQWINPRYAKEPRPHHVAISGNRKPIGEKWLGKLLYPGDPHGPIGETINCHCYIRRVR